MATNTTPAKASGDLIDRLVVASWSRGNNELELAAIARDANALMRVDAANAHMVLGSVAATRGNSGDMRHHYGIALRLNQHPYTVQRNYSVALATLTEHQEALEVALAMLEAYPDDVELFDHAIDQALESAQFDKAAELLERLHRIAPKRKRWRAAVVGEVRSAIAAGSFTQERVRGLLLGASAIQLRAGLPSVGIRFKSQDGGESFFYVRDVQATADETAELNEQLADFATSREDLMDDPGMKFVAAFSVATKNGSNP